MLHIRPTNNLLIEKYKFHYNSLFKVVLKGLILLEHGADTKHVFQDVKPPPPDNRW